VIGLFPEDSAARKEYPIYSGFLQYFPAAIAAIARHSYLGNQKHNPGQPLHHDRAKSDDEPDAQMRHLMEGDLVGMAWRALSQLQKHLEANGAPIAPAARNATLPTREPPHVGEAIALADGVVANGAGLVPSHIAEAMMRDGVIPRDDDEGELVPVESLGRDG
jgi:hypothetical protein